VEPSKKEGMDKNFSIVTEGANLDLFTLWQVNRQKNIKGALDLTRVTCNDISQIRRTLGSVSLAFRSPCLSLLVTFLSALIFVTFLSALD
jgi:hypothetical protein